MHFRTPLFAGHLWFLPRRHFGFSHWKQIVSRYCPSKTDIHMFTKIWFVFVGHSKLWTPACGKHWFAQKKPRTTSYIRTRNGVRNHAFSDQKTTTFGHLARIGADAWHHCLFRKHAFSNASLCRSPLVPPKKTFRVFSLEAKLSPDTVRRKPIYTCLQRYDSSM